MESKIALYVLPSRPPQLCAAATPEPRPAPKLNKGASTPFAAQEDEAQPILSGRGLDQLDMSSPRVAVVTEQFAQTFFHVKIRLDTGSDLVIRRSRRTY
jgi:hypothetical protein